MPEPSDEHFLRFIQAAHRRWLLWRVLERAGLSVLAGCGIALPLLAILWWRGESAVWLVGAILALIAIFGIILGLRRRPSLLETAMEADRQLDLHDLLSSAMQLRRGPYIDTEWSANLMALAEAHCRGVSPSQLVLHRLNTRAWSGIGLAAALVFTLSLMTTAPMQTSVRADAAGAFAPPPSVEGKRETAPQRDRDAAVGRAGLRKGEPLPSEDSQSRFTDRTDHRSTAADENPPLSDRPTDRGAGAGAAKTDVEPDPAPLKLSAQSNTDVPSRQTDPTAPGRATTSQSETGDDSVSGTSAGTRSSLPAPWRLPTWPASRAAAMNAIHAGQVPDEYRDLVREYFSDRD